MYALHRCTVLYGNDENTPRITRDSSLETRRRAV